MIFRVECRASGGTTAYPCARRSLGYKSRSKRSMTARMWRTAQSPRKASSHVHPSVGFYLGPPHAAMPDADAIDIERFGMMT